MSSDLLYSSMAGALFGSALTASGVYLPSVIVSQLQLQNFHMLKVFLTASSASALVLALYERLARRKLNRRAPSNLAWLGTYDGNIIGGMMTGAGMALTGACPGTVLVQVGTGVSSGRYAIIGGTMGGILYTLLKTRLRPTPACADSNENYSVSSKLGMKQSTAILMFEIMCISMIVAVRYIDPSQTKYFLDPVMGGLLIGAAQLAALLLTSSPVGVSTCYEDIGNWFCALFNSSPGAKKCLVPATRSIAFATGILLSSFALSRAVPEMILEDSLTVSPARGILGGLIMVLGSRIAGGCTSGHGISGMSMLSLSSIITVASMFASGIGISLLM